jgi:hypothetical protein
VLIRALLILAIGFALLFLTRVGAARRRVLMARWPAIAFAVAAIFEASRGGLQLALVLGGLAVLSWFIAPRLLAPASAEKFPDDPADTQARAVLGVGTAAGEGEIRRAYRAKMAKAHPDQGGQHADAARLTAARDRLLRKQR